MRAHKKSAYLVSPKWVKSNERGKIQELMVLIQELMEQIQELMEQDSGAYQTTRQG